MSNTKLFSQLFPNFRTRSFVIVNLQSRGIPFSTINLILIEEELNDSDDEYDEEGRQYVEKLQKKSVSLIFATCRVEKIWNLSNGLKEKHIKHSAGLLSQIFTIILLQGNSDSSIVS